MRMMTGAYLINENKVLMMKRSQDRSLAPNLWTGIGGHIEDNEHNAPQDACLREIYEETGITSTEIERLRLCYILFRRDEAEIRQHFIYFGHSSKVDLINSDEGDLHWIDVSDIPNLEMPLTVKYMFKHYLDNQNGEEVFVGTVNKSQIKWACLNE
jgi:8-oxo-dGTP diphosphatase